MKLIVQPDAGVVPVVQAIRKSKKTLDVCIFRFDVAEIERAMGAAVQRGVRVRALIAHTNRGGENHLRKLEQRLLAAGVAVSRTADDLLRYHAKYMIADDTLHLFGFNFTKLDILKSRSFSVATRDSKTVRDATDLFEADVSRQPYKAGKSHLVVSPDTSREKLTEFIKGAKKELAIYDVKVQDPLIVKLLKERGAKGVRIRILGAIKKGDDTTQARPLKPIRLHVRCVIRDGTRAFVGSQSLRKEELDSRREVGVLITNPSVTKKIMAVFEQDWTDSAPKDAKNDELAVESKDDKKSDKPADDEKAS
ncbi:MAG TPA: phospholipase D-like domain-containing protein [Vicinamibacterales bacterium]|nr:phospholipase D-like domain-containing protein [Vicinamibacterales bacterium]